MDEQPASGVTGDAAALMKARLREDLRASMRAKELLRVRVLRMLIAALDNAQAVPLADPLARYVERPFGDRSVEVPRLCLGGEEVQRVLTQELTSRSEAADELEQLGRTDRAGELRAEAAIIRGYSAASAE